MSHVTECIELYVGDDEVSDSQFRALILDAAARDNGHVEHGYKPGFTTEIVRALDDGAVRTQLAEHAHALVLLNKLDDVRAGQIRVLRERLDNMEGK